MLLLRFKLPIDAVSSLQQEGLGSIKYNCIATIFLPDDGESELIAGKLSFFLNKILKKDSILKSGIQFLEKKCILKN